MSPAKGWILMMTLAAVACGGTSPAQGDVSEVADTGIDAAVDVALPDAAPDATPDLVDAAPPDWVAPEWSRQLPGTDGLGQRRQFHVARAILHLHNVFSHDACDGQPRLADGSPNEACHQQLRDALCANHVDYAMMTDHFAFMAETDDFEALYMHHDGDTWEDEGGEHSANVMPCTDGHQVRLTVGLEGEASPLGIRRHPVEGDTATRTAAYQDSSAEGVQKLRDAGAVPVVIHTEDRTDDWLDHVDVDLFETCNLHILLAPNIRGQVGLDPGAAALAFANWAFKPDEYPAVADLVFLEFHERVAYYMDQWDRQLGLRMMGGFAGNDAHQNVMQKLMADGERGDGYRRMTTWYVNHLLVTERTARAAREALHARRLYEVFEVLGTPADFDFYAVQGGTAYEMGDAVPPGATVTLHAPTPTSLGLPAGLDTVRLVLRKVTPAAATTVYDGPGPLAYEAGPGRYRLEVFVTPSHLASYLGSHAERLLREYPWIYSNPIEVR
jgi:hypothetical protein